MVTIFSRLPRTSASVDAMRMIKELIITGRLQPGDKLPPERELAEMLGISRPTIRESIRVLEALNILVVRHGKGTYVGRLDTEELLEPLNFVFAMARGALSELFEARLVIEPPMASFAAERATAAQIEGLRRQVELSRELQDSPEDFVEVDVQLHRMIAEASGNKLLISQLSSLHALSVGSRTLTVRLPHVAQKTVADHSAIVQAIAFHKPLVARKAMTNHLVAVAAAARATAEVSVHAVAKRAPLKALRA